MCFLNDFITHLTSANKLDFDGVILSFWVQLAPGVHKTLKKRGKGKNSNTKKGVCEQRAREIEKDRKKLRNDHFIIIRRGPDGNY